MPTEYDQCTLYYTFIADVFVSIEFLMMFLSFFIRFMFHSLIGPLLLGYLDLTPRSTTMDDGITYLPHSTTTTTSSAADDGFAMPAPRQPSGRRLVPSSLLSKNDSEDDGDEDFFDCDNF